MRKKMQVKNILWLIIGLSLFSLGGCEGTKDREAKYLGKAQAHFDEKNYEKMQVDLKNVLQINPKNVEARYLMALAAEKDQDWRKMFGNLSAVVEAKPDHYDAQLKLGMLFLFSKDSDKATEKVELVLAKQPDHPDALALKATIHLSRNEKEEAKALLNKALEAEAGHYDASLLMIKILGEEKNLEQAKQILDTALTAHPDKLKLSLVKINVLLLEQKKDEVELLYKDLLQRFPENEALHYNLAKFYIADKKIDLAEQVLKNLVNQLAEKDQPKYVLIDFLTRQRGVEQTEKELDILIKENPDNFGFKFAKITLYKDNPEKIQQILEQIVEQDKLGPAGIDARNKLALLLNSQNKQEPARILVEEVIELDSTNSQALLLRAGFQMRDSDFEGAIADTRTILRNEPESEKALMVQAVAHLKLNNFELAQESLEKVLLINPKNLIAAKDLARIKVGRKDDAGAIELLEKFRIAFKDDRDISIMLIDLYGKKQEWDKAEIIAKELLNDSETKELPHYKLAQLYMGQKKYQDAITEFSIVLNSKPTAPDVLAGLVNSHLALKQEKEAEKVLDNALATNKDNPALLTMRAELYRNKKQFTDAERLFKRVIELKPKVELGYKNLATVYLIQKQLDNALAVYQQGLLAIPESGGFYMQLAIINTFKDDTVSAIDAYEKLLSKLPDNLLAINNLAALLVESSDQKQVEKALTLIAPLKDSEYTPFLDTYGWVNYKNGKTDDALMALETATRKKDAIPEMHYHLGMVYIAKGRVEEAKLELEKAVADDAKYKTLETAKAELEKLKAM